MAKKNKAHFPKRPPAPVSTRSDVSTVQSGTDWVRRKLTARFTSDAHLGSGSGGGGIDALVARDRRDHPVIWASHLEGVLRDAARRLKNDKAAEEFFGSAGGTRQSAIFTSLYVENEIVCRNWTSTAREAFDNRAPKDDTLRAIEFVPGGTEFIGEVELPASQLDTLERLLQEVDALGSGRATGAGRVKLSLSELTTTSRNTGIPTGRLMLLLKNRDPLCITATATPDNLIPSLAFVPGRTLLGALAAWLMNEGECEVASMLTSGQVGVSDALPLPEEPPKLDRIEVLPAPLSLQSEKPNGVAGDVPWWALAPTPTRRLDAWSTDAERKLNGVKLKRPEDDLFVYRRSASEAWTTFRPALRVRLRNGRPDPKQLDASLFAIEQIVEKTYFLAELHGSPEDLRTVAGKLGPVLEGRRWLRVGRAGAPVEVSRTEWGKTADAASVVDASASVKLILTSDLLVRDELLRWRTGFDDPESDQKAFRELIGTEDITIAKTERGSLKALQDSVMVHGFNGTSRLWRMPAAAIRRGSVFEVSGAGVAKLAERVAKNEWLGERTHEGFGRFRIDVELPGVTSEVVSGALSAAPDVDEDAIAAKTQEWFNAHKSLSKPGGGIDRKPSLSQWFDLVSELEANNQNALTSRLKPTTAAGRSWENKDAKAILDKLNKLEAPQQKTYARFFVRWLRAEMRKNSRGHDDH